MNSDEKWMSRALLLAEKGRFGASPNPMVGCVVVSNGRAVGEGWHARFGGPHAEIEALRRAGSRAKGATLYLNLEPCSHWGKTPPCADAVIRAGVREVVAAMRDPNFLVAGKGFAKLRKAGVKVRIGTMRREAERLNRAFLKFIRRKRPYVVLKSAMSLDGKIATASGDSRWISSEASRRCARKLRSEMDAVLVGGETVRRDDPSLTSHGLGRDPVRVVLTASGRLPARAKIFDGKARTWVVHGRKNLRGKPGADWFFVRPRGGRLPFGEVVSLLGARGISKLLIEGGGETAASALGSGEADEVLFFVAPVLIGGKDAPTPIEGKGVRKVADAWKLRDLSVERIGPDLLVRGFVEN